MYKNCVCDAQVQQVNVPMYMNPPAYQMGMVSDVRTMNWVQSASPTQSSDCGQEQATTSVSCDLSGNLVLHPL